MKNSLPLPSPFSYPVFARYVITCDLQKRIVPDPFRITHLMKGEYPELSLPKACFVSIKCRDGALRGCIGTLFPNASCLTEELISNARAAAFQDPRFSPVKEQELSSLLFSCDILETPEKTSFELLDPKNFGVIVSKNSRRGVLLPNLEGVETPLQQVQIAMKKAGIFETSLENVDLMSFRVTRYEE
ncbi:MAG TPA: AmmeMemoRadiSam system protein A [Synergistaceae bacterium]|nr:AmmeMemoRadiSam system protein A [Synergistaceae bacterium]HPJ24614.1 AmmeMemoRadiSam system protein A [Synergistaceae bacterium]HPQ36191.1 AmmeMemoRadiSam system protein A [Synergistaceae bacterium]